MAELFDGNGTKIIAFFLPQYHCIPENDRWWGKGFTEWVNTRKALPLFEGHYQPRTPLHENYYNLLDPKVLKWQADLARQYGVFGFCHYHYWFKGGKQLLEKPTNAMLADPTIDIPFCLSWANENWTRNWDGGNREVIAEQDYGGPKEWEAHFQYLLPFFQDRRYMTEHGKPLFLIYKPELIPHLNQMLDYWTGRIQEYGFPGICYMIQSGGWYFDPDYDDSRFSWQIRFEPAFSKAYKSKQNMQQVKRMQNLFGFLRKCRLEKPAGFLYDRLQSAHKAHTALKELELVSYEETWQTILQSPTEKKTALGGFVDWDNTARNKKGRVYQGASPELFGEYLKKLVHKVETEAENPYLFLNAWNEWAEGAYLEPDERYGYAYLEAVQAAVSQKGETR